MAIEYGNYIWNSPICLLFFDFVNMKNMNELEVIISACPYLNVEMQTVSIAVQVSIVRKYIP